jgi:hypothetical protein
MPVSHPLIWNLFEDKHILWAILSDGYYIYDRKNDVLKDQRQLIMLWNKVRKAMQ